MRRFRWDDTKNEWLKKERGISFEDVVAAIEGGHVLAVQDHPNKTRYPHQRIIVVRISGYVCVVPYVPSDQGVFLKTIIPNRKEQRRFSQGEHRG